MALVPYVKPEEGPGADRLVEFEEEHGKRSLLLEALGNHPPLLDAHSYYFQKTVGEGNLDRELKELIGVYVSELNECEYCASSHRGNLIEMMGIPEDTVEQILDGDFESLSARETAALAFAEQVVEDPKRITEDDLKSLHEAGFGDDGIVELLGVIAQFAVENLYVDTLSIFPSDR
jgi:uncharacterized peroxidase-related enzyme